MLYSFISSLADWLIGQGSRRRMTHKKLNRRGFLKVAAVGAGVVVVGGITRQVHNQIGRNFQPERAQAYLNQIQANASTEIPPNIIIILCDDLGVGDLESTAIDQPNLRRMADEGTTHELYAAARVQPILSRTSTGATPWDLFHTCFQPIIP
jgi:hypothetical protein